MAGRSRYLDDGEHHVDQDDEQQRGEQDGVSEGARDRRNSLRVTAEAVGGAVDQVDAEITQKVFSAHVAAASYVAAGKDDAVYAQGTAVVVEA